jgi:predicted nucleic acid-binding protein
VDLIVDTQILSYQFKGVEKGTQSKGLAISSITANEFLVAQPINSDQPDYYIIHPAIYSHLLYAEGSGFGVPEHFGNPKWARMGARRTDQVIIDFGNQFSAYREFGNEAISEIINEKHLEIYKISIAHLPKQKQKYLLKRLKYILDSGYYCYSLTRSAVDQALNLFSEFVSEHNCKGNVRNTINDLLILSTAIDREKKFLTNDNLLNRFAAEYYEAPIHKDKDELLIDFSKQPVEKRKSRESKGYINKGWSYAVRNNRTTPET